MSCTSQLRQEVLNYNNGQTAKQTSHLEPTTSAHMVKKWKFKIGWKMSELFNPRDKNCKNLGCIGTICQTSLWKSFHIKSEWIDIASR